MTRRVRDWQSRLQACLAERRALAFEWGQQDCVLFAADCAGACTGVDPAAAYRGTYSDAVGAARLVQSLGGMQAIGDAHLGARVSPRLARVGDIGLVLNDGRECFAVCIGAMWQAPAELGLCALPADQVTCAWRVERED